MNKFNELDAGYFQHDNEITAAENGLQKNIEEYQDTAADLKMVQSEFDMLREEKRKRDEIAAMLEKKNKEFTDKMDKISKASAFIQAHWMGMVARKERDKAMKGKRKKKGKKK